MVILMNTLIKIVMVLVYAIDANNVENEELGSIEEATSSILAPFLLLLLDGLYLLGGEGKRNHC